MKKITFAIIAMSLLLFTNSCGIILESILSSNTSDATSSIDITTENYLGLLVNKLELTIRNNGSQSVKDIQLELHFQNER